jgi:hypothetical protein
VASDDPAALAFLLDRAAFVARFPEPILVGALPVNRASTADLTRTFPANSWDDLTSRDFSKSAPPVAAWVVRKARRGRSALITVGRGPMNDISIPNETVSKLHAVFEYLEGGGLGVADAGSSNGVWVDEQRLPAHGQAVPIGPGTRLRLGNVNLSVVDSGTFWDGLRKA